MLDLKTLGAAIGWVGSSVAGISALLYAIGFIATLYHLNLMGIDTELVSRDGFIYVGRGAVALNKAFLFIVLGGIVAALILWLYGLIVGGVARLGAFFRKRSRGEPFDFSGLFSAWLLFGVILVLLVVALNGFATTQIPSGGLLFNRPACPDGGVRLVCDTQAANRAFGQASIFAGAILILCWVGGARVGVDGLGRRIVLAAYAVTGLFVVFFMVPVAYGTLIMHEEMPAVTLTPPDAQRLGLGDARLQLLRQDSSGLLLWLRDTRQLAWTATGEVKTVRLGSPNANPAPPPGGQVGGKP